MSYKLILRFEINIVYIPCDNYYANANISDMSKST